MRDVEHCWSRCPCRLSDPSSGISVWSDTLSNDRVVDGTRQADTAIGSLTPADSRSSSSVGPICHWVPSSHTWTAFCYRAVATSPPEFYGAEPDPETGGVDIERDRAEIALFEAATAAGLPVLAVCRGLQLVNVAQGGTLVQHLPATTSVPHLDLERRRELVHSVQIDPESELGNIIAPNDLGVNSIHHQAVDRAERRPPDRCLG